MRFNKRKIEIYQYLVGTHPYGAGKQFCPARIAEFLGISKSYVSRITRKLVSEKYIVKINPGSKPILYSSTRQKPPVHKFTYADEKSTTPTPGQVNHFTTPPGRGVSEQGSFTTSKSRWSCSIESLPSDLSGWTVKELRNGVKQYYKKILFGKPIDDVVVFQIVGKTKFTMTLTFPRFTFDSIGNFRNSRDIIRDFAKMAFRHVSQRFRIPLKVKHTHFSSGDFEHPLRDVDIKNFIDTATVTINFKNGFQHVGKLDFDGSGRVDNIESDIPDWIADYSEIPSFSRRLQSLEKGFEQVFDRYFTKINHRIEEIIEEKMNQMMQYNPDFNTDFEGYR